MRVHILPERAEVREQAVAGRVREGADQQLIDFLTIFLSLIITYGIEYAQSKFNYTMGSSASAREKYCQEKADEVRNGLYRRVDAFKKDYQRQFDSIKHEDKIIIKQSSAFELTRFMDQGKYTSYTICLVFIERSASIGVKNNYIVDQLFESALQKAKEIDQIRQNSPKKKCWRYGDNKEQTFPPFFGVPVSLKENIMYPGRPNYVGYAIPFSPTPQEQSEFNILTRKMGLIPFVRTSVPQGVKTLETNNNIVGYCKNPWNDQRSCNGSSGGEGGILGSQCSPIGIGTDIAGSLRGPAQFSGLTTMKPYYRYSNIGSAFTGSFSSGLFLRNQIGVMSKSVEDVIIWHQFMYDKQNYIDIPRKLKDPYLRLTPFKHKVFEEKKTYKIGYFTEFKDFIKSSPSHRRAIYQAVRIAEAHGHTAVEINIKNVQRMLTILGRLWYGNDDLECLNELRQGQKVIPEYADFFKAKSLPPAVKTLYTHLMATKEPRFTQILKKLNPFSVGDYMNIVHELEKIKKETYDYLQRNEIQIMICPGFAFPAWKFGYGNKLTQCASFTLLSNILNYVAGTLPVTVVQQDEQYFEDFFMDRVYRAANDCMKDSVGLPVGIQVISYPGHEQQVLYVMQQLEQEINFWKRYQSRASELSP